MYLRNSQGYSLIELTIGMGILTIALTAMAYITQTQARAVSTATAVLESNDFILELSNALNEQKLCGATLSGQPTTVVDSETGPSLNLTIGSTTVTPGENGNYGKSLIIRSARLINKTLIENNDFRGTLEVNISIKGSGYGTKALKRQYPVYFTDNGAGQIDQCIPAVSGNGRMICTDLFGTWDPVKKSCNMQSQTCNDGFGAYGFELGTLPADTDPPCEVARLSCNAIGGNWTHSTRDGQNFEHCELCSQLGMGTFDPTTGKCSDVTIADSGGNP